MSWEETETTLEDRTMWRSCVAQCAGDTGRTKEGKVPGSGLGWYGGSGGSGAASILVKRRFFIIHNSHVTHQHRAVDDII